MRTSRHVLVALTLAVTASAQDTVHVKAGAPAWGTHVAASPLYTLGTAPDYRIRIFYGMAVDKSNRVYVHDLDPMSGNPHVDAYDANGNYVKTFGRKGSGPGEYRTIFGMTVVNDSVLAAWDASNARITLWEPDGSLLRTLQLDKAYTGTSWFALSADTTNLMYLRTQFYVYDANGRLAKDQPPEGNPVFARIDVDGKIVDSVIAPHFDELPQKRLTYGAYVSQDNFVPQASIKPSRMGGVVYGRGDVYRFAIQPSDRFVIGDAGAPSATPRPGARRVHAPVRVVEKDWTPVPLTSEERDQWTALGDAQKNRDGTMGGYTVPKVKPAYKDLFVDADGRIWINLYALAAKRELPARDPKITTPRIYWQQQPVYDVFDHDGRYLGNVALPWHTGNLLQAQGDRVWLHGVGPDDEHLVTCFRLTGLKVK